MSKNPPPPAQEYEFVWFPLYLNGQIFTIPSRPKPVQPNPVQPKPVAGLFDFYPNEHREYADKVARGFHNEWD